MRATWLAATPPICVKLPPAYRKPSPTARPRCSCRHPRRCATAGHPTPQCFGLRRRRRRVNWPPTKTLPASMSRQRIRTARHVAVVGVYALAERQPFSAQQQRNVVHTLGGDRAEVAAGYDIVYTSSQRVDLVVAFVGNATATSFQLAPSRAAIRSTALPPAASKSPPA